jgi:hypothetical protein
VRSGFERTTIYWRAQKKERTLPAPTPEKSNISPPNPPFRHNRIILPGLAML